MDWNWNDMRNYAWGNESVESICLRCCSHIKLFSIDCKKRNRKNKRFCWRRIQNEKKLKACSLWTIESLSHGYFHRNRSHFPLKMPPQIEYKQTDRNISAIVIFCRRRTYRCISFALTVYRTPACAILCTMVLCLCPCAHYVAGTA